MKRFIASTAAVLAVLLLPTGPCVATGNTAGVHDGAHAKKTTARVSLVDINTASKAQLKKLPGITDERADKIIAGRPYLSKAHLVTRGVLPLDVYESIKDQVMAKPKSA